MALFRTLRNRRNPNDKTIAIGIHTNRPIASRSLWSSLGLWQRPRDSRALYYRTALGGRGGLSGRNCTTGVWTRPQRRKPPPCQDEGRGLESHLPLSRRRLRERGAPNSAPTPKTPRSPDRPTPTDRAGRSAAPGRGRPPAGHTPPENGAAARHVSERVGFVEGRRNARGGDRCFMRPGPQNLPLAPPRTSPAALQLRRCRWKASARSRDRHRGRCEEGEAP